MLIARYIQVRDDKAAMAKVHAEQMKPFSEALGVLETALQDMLNQVGGDNIKTPSGTAYRSTTTSCKVEDWPGFISFVIDNGDTELLVRNVNKTRFQELAEAGVTVPGISTSQFHAVNVRRS